MKSWHSLLGRTPRIFHSLLNVLFSIVGSDLSFANKGEVEKGRYNRFFLKIFEKYVK